MVTFTSLLAGLAATTSVASALGINCRGSGLCSGNGGMLGQAQGRLRGMDQNRRIGDGEHAVCIQSSVTVGNPSLCIFYQKTGRSWTIGQTVTYVQYLLDHGCGACGSVPVDSGNNVDNGELTANMVARGNKRRGDDEIWFETMDEPVATAAAVIAKREPEPEPEVAAAAAVAPLVSRADTPAKLLERALGINCRGSSTCGVGGIGHSPSGTLQRVRDAVAAGPEGTYYNGQQIACIPHVAGRLCAFYQKVGWRSFNKGQTIWYLDALLNHGCRICGSVPTDDGNNTDNGELTVNYVG